MAVNTLARKPKSALVIVGREASESAIDYYIQSGENTYIARIENGTAVGCNRTTKEACEGFYYQHKCRHTALALSNEQDRDNDLKQHLHDGISLHSCISCGYQVKHPNSLCHKCAW